MAALDKKYNAFISYSHADCGHLTPAIQKAIENIGKPWYAIGRIITTFRDETNLSASPELWNSILKAIEDSENFILIASPLAAKSHWVEKEIYTWLSNNNTNGKIFIVLAEGEILWNNDENDFDWNTTNSLPAVLSKKFSQEPLWVDLRDYINLNDKSINYKAAGFTLAMTKIIGGLTGKAPREIESDELTRNRKTKTFLLLSSVIFIVIMVSGIFFFRENKINNQNAIVNNLVAEANKLRESNINKALLLYAYAFNINKSESVRKLLEDYYRSHVFIDTSLIAETDPSSNNAFMETTDSINTFYRKIKGIESAINLTQDYNNDFLYHYVSINDTITKYVKKIFINLPAKEYYSYESNGYIVSSNLINNMKVDSIKFDPLLLKKLFYNLKIPSLGAFFYNNKNDYEDSTFKLYDLTRKHNDLYLTFGTEYPNLKEFGSEVGLSQDGKTLARLVNPRAFENIGVNFVLYDLTTMKEKSYALDLRYLSWENFQITDMNLSNNAKYLYLSLSGGSDGYTVDCIVNIETNKIVQLSNGSGRSNGQLKNQIAQFLWDENNNYFIYATYDGNIHYVDIANIHYTEEVNDEMALMEKNIMDFEDNDFDDEEVNSNSNAFAGMEKCNKYIFSALKDGQITGYRNPFRKKDDWANRYPLEKAFSFKLNSASEIYSLDYDQNTNSLYITTENGEIFCVNLSHYILLTNDPDKIINQLTTEIGIEDLSATEKLSLKIF